jgi:DNA-binding transcriptional LysR family regulator
VGTEGGWRGGYIRNIVGEAATEFQSTPDESIIDIVNIRKVDLNLLKAFEALFAERNVGRAAGRLGIGQPATSNALARLRATFGDELFRRDGRTMVPTPLAVELAEPIGRALEAAREALRPRTLPAPASLRRKFNISGGDYASMTILPPLLRRLRVQAPLVDLRLRFIEKDRAFDLLDAGELDLAIGVFPKVPKRLRSTTIFEERFRCVLHTDHPALREPMTPASYAALPHLLVTERGDEYGAVDDALAALGLSRRIVLTVPSVLAARRLVLESDLIATVGERLARLFAQDSTISVFAPPVDLAPWRMSVLWPLRARKDKALTWLIARILESGREV